MAFADLIVGKWNRNLFPWFTPGSRLSGCISFVSYIKPQLTVTKKEPSSSCISFVSYIKPQRRRIQQHHHWVVYLSFPTSNHNSSLFGLEDNKLYIFRFLHQTTTLLLQGLAPFLLYIFLFLHQTTTATSTHSTDITLYIFRFLHQTTTNQKQMIMLCRCISFVSYIKPQLTKIRRS